MGKSYPPELKLLRAKKIIVNFSRRRELFLRTQSEFIEQPEFRDSFKDKRLNQRFN